MGRRLPGIYRHGDGHWWVDKVVGGRRLQKAFGADYAEAEEWLLKHLMRVRAAREGERPRFTFEEASCRYLQEHESKLSLEDEILYLKLAMPYVGALLLDEICDETLEPLVIRVEGAGGQETQGRAGDGTGAQEQDRQPRAWHDSSGVEPRRAQVARRG